MLNILDGILFRNLANWQFVSKSGQPVFENAVKKFGVWEILHLAEDELGSWEFLAYTEVTLYIWNNGKQNYL